MSLAAFSLAGSIMDKDRRHKFLADFERGMNLGFVAEEPMPLAPDAMPITTPDAYSKFPISTPVRDILSGLEGVVAEPPKGEFGDVVFITCNEDGKTYAVRFDQVQAIEQPMSALPPPMPAAPELPVPGAEAKPAAEPTALEPAALKVVSEKYREHIKLRAATRRLAASITDKTLVVAASDERKFTFAQLKANLQAIKEPMAKDAVAFIGYVPTNFDSIWAALSLSGIKVAAASEAFDVKEMLTKGLTADEIKFMVCSANGGVLAKVEAELKMAADVPMTEKPQTPAPAGQVYVWNAQKGNWMLVQASEGKDTIGEPVKVPSQDHKAPASGAPSYPVEKNKEEVATGSGKDTAGPTVKVPSQDHKAPASGAPAYPVLDPDKAGGMKAGSEVVNDSVGGPVDVKTFDKKAGSSGAPKYEVAGPAKGGDAPRDQTVDTLGPPVEVKTFDQKSPASGAPDYPVLDPDNAGGQAAPGTHAVPGGPGAGTVTDVKPMVTPNAQPPAEVPAAVPAPAPVAEVKPVPAPEQHQAPPTPVTEKKPEPPKPEKKAEGEDKPKDEKKPEGEKPKDEKPKDENKSDDEKPKDEKKPEGEEKEEKKDEKKPESKDEKKDKKDEGKK